MLSLEMCPPKRFDGVGIIQNTFLYSGCSVLIILSRSEICTLHLYIAKYVNIVKAPYKMSNARYIFYFYVLLVVCLYTKICNAIPIGKQSLVNITKLPPNLQELHDSSVGNAIVPREVNSSATQETRNSTSQLSKTNDLGTKTIRCSQNVLCYESVNHVLNLISKYNISRHFGYNFSDDSELHLFHLRDSKTVSVRKFLSSVLAKRHRLLCSDKQTAGFLLETGSEKWPIACMWTASNNAGTCVPAPFSANSTSAFTYKSSFDMRKKLAIAEVYYCRDRCTDGGLGIVDILILLWYARKSLLRCVRTIEVKFEEVSFTTVSRICLFPII
ncbi:hypothetical protein Ddc_18770 [Ditylenchus destructor]|nr:hypothetical protein Ddc_18770 [Ditylenchus destructor]